MKAEERKQLERNELAARLNTAWQGLSSNSTTVTIIWSVILIGLVALIGYRYYARSSAETRSELWSRLDRAADVSELEKIIKDNPSTEAGRIAKFHLSRFQLQDSLTRLASTTNDEKLKAADEIEKARDRYAELIKESTRESLLTQEAMMEVAKAEEVLAGVPTEKDPNAMRGSLEKALEAYDALAKKYPHSFLGEKAAKRATEIRDRRSQVEAFYLSLSKVQGKTETPPAPPTPTPIFPTPAPILPGPDLPKSETPKPDAPKADLPKAPEAGKTGEPKS
jgi:hypothetical protein